MKVTETTHKGRRKVVAVNDGEAPLRFRVEIIDEGLEDWLVSSSQGRARALQDAARALFVVAGGAWSAFRAGVSESRLEGEPVGGMVPPEMRSEHLRGRPSEGPSPLSLGVLVGPGAAAAAEVA